MIRIGDILIDPNSVDTILRDGKVPGSDKERGIHTIQIIYKSGVVKNFKSSEIGMSYLDFINAFEKAVSKEEDRRLFKLMSAINANNR